MDSNRITLQGYNARLQEYIDGSPQDISAGLKQFIDGAFADVKAGAAVLEVGAGFGRDAFYLQSKGFAVIPTDATDSFVEELQRRGLPAYRLAIILASFPRADVTFSEPDFLHLIPHQDYYLAKA